MMCHVDIENDTDPGYILDFDIGLLNPSDDEIAEIAKLILGSNAVQSRFTTKKKAPYIYNLYCDWTRVIPFN